MGQKSFLRTANRGTDANQPPRCIFPNRRTGRGGLRDYFPNRLQTEPERVGAMKGFIFQNFSDAPRCIFPNRSRMKPRPPPGRNLPDRSGLPVKPLGARLRAV